MPNMHTHTLSYQPTIFPAQSTDENTRFRKYCSANGIINFIDNHEEEAKELFAIRHPEVLRGEQVADTTTERDGVWICYPWRHTAIHCLPMDEFIEVRTSRNHNLITKDEAKQLTSLRIAVAGLNVGNPGAVCLALESIGGYFRLADNDTLSLSNLNRFRASLCDLGLNKALLSARQMSEINPFLDIDVWEKGVSTERLGEFLENIDILIEEMDNLPLKISIREEARKRKIPVIMVTGNGADIIIDIERFDREPELPLLAGKLTPEVVDAIAKGSVVFEEKIVLAQDFMGKAYLGDRLNASFPEVGKTLAGIPQLAEASFLRGAALARAVRAIRLNSENSASGRYAFGESTIKRIS